MPRKNVEEALKYGRDYYHNNKLACAERKKRWRKANPKRAALTQKCIRARIRGKKYNSPGNFTIKDIDLIYIEQNGLCYYCGNELNDNFELEHKIPLSRKGTNWPDNLCCSCVKCNKIKATDTEEEFLDYIYRIYNHIAFGQHHSF